MFNSVSKKEIDLAKAVEPVLQDLSRRINGVLRSMDAVRYAADKGNVSGVIDGLDLIANSFLDARDIKVNNGFINSFIEICSNLIMISPLNCLILYHKQFICQILFMLNFNKILMIRIDNVYQLYLFLNLHDTFYHLCLLLF